MATNATIKIGADTSESQPKFDKLRKSAKGTADEFGRAGSKAKTLGQEVDKMGQGMLRSMVGLTSMVGAIRSAVAAVEAVRSAQISGTQERGKTTVTAGVSLGRLTQAGKVTGDEAEQIQQQVQNMADREAGAAIVQSLTDKALTDRKFGARLTGDAMKSALAAYESGTFTKAELEDYIKKGKRFDVAERQAALPPGVRKEIETQRAEAFARRGPEDVSGRERVLEAEMKRRKDEEWLYTFVPDFALRARMRADRRTGRPGDERTNSLDTFSDLLQARSGFDVGTLKDQEVNVRVINPPETPKPRPQLSGSQQSER